MFLILIVLVRVVEPSVSGVDGMHDQAPLSDAVVLQIVLPPTVTVTVASGSLVPDTVGVVERSSGDADLLLPLFAFRDSRLERMQSTSRGRLSHPMTRVLRNRTTIWKGELPK